MNANACCFSLNHSVKATIMVDISFCDISVNLPLQFSKVYCHLFYRAESLAQSLSVSLYGSASDIASTPRRRRRSWSQSIEHLESGQTTGRGTSTPFSPVDDMDTRTKIQLVNLCLQKHYCL